MPSLPRTVTLLTSALAALHASSAAQRARISEEVRVLTTYPFSEPNPVPILTRDARLYPYHSFEGYAADGVPQEWRVVRLENDHIELFVLPEAGGKVWGAVVKRTGHEFIYRNEVMKFRNIALRGPWTSGGLEFNFGVIGHTPTTATPVDYVLRENPDGSVSCIVGTMDLPSRTHWRVEVRLPADRAYFETNVLWYNPTPLEQPYYNWMTAAAFARNDLELFVPGNAYLEHSGHSRPWPVDSAGRYLPAYAQNAFGSHKSYHVVGELEEFFGGYYHDDGYGFGQWARYEEMPGQKLWLWSLAGDGAVWEDLLTDTDGQYIEFQAGRLFVQYAAGSDVNPITQAVFDPGATDRWTETWFPVEGLGGITDASRDGAMHVTREGSGLHIRAHAFGDVADTLRVTADGRVVVSIPIAFRALEPLERTVDLGGASAYRVELPVLGLAHDSDPAAQRLSRPFATDPAARAGIPGVDLRTSRARELAKARLYHEARAAFEAVLAEVPWQPQALVGLAELEYRRGRYEAGLAYANRALQLDAYNAQANFVAGTLFRAMGQVTDAHEAFGWAARSMAYRAAAYAQLAELMLAQGNVAEAARYAQSALDYSRHGIPARQVLAMAARHSGDAPLASTMREELLALDPLHHFVTAERYLAAPDAGGDALLASLRSEYPEQTLLELAVDYVRRGAVDDARALLRLGTRAYGNPLLGAWLAWLDDDPAELPHGADLRLVFPYRRETLPVLAWAAGHDGDWRWSYLLALNLWALDRADEAAALLEAVGDQPDFAPLYVSRGLLLDQLRRRDPEADLRRAVHLEAADRTLRIHLVRYLQRRSRWDDALAASAAARTRFPGDFNLDLLHVQSLLQLGRPEEATAILDVSRVLPSENSGDSHRLWEQAHTMAALDALERGANDAASEHLHAALEWPLHLGQGRPYQPEERLVRHLLGIAEGRLGDTTAARASFEAVLSATVLQAEPGPLDLLAVPAAVALRRESTLQAAWASGTTDAARLAQALVAGVRDGERAHTAAARLATRYPALFDDFAGRLILRALTVSP